MCFTDFPTETADEALADAELPRRACASSVAVYIVGEFDLTHGALVAQSPERFGIDEAWQLEGDELGTGLFYEEAVPSKTRRRSGTRRRSARWLGGRLVAAPLSLGGIAVDRAHRLLLRALRQGRAAIAGAAGRGRRDRRARGDGGGALRSGGSARRRGRGGRHLARAGARAPRRSRARRIWSWRRSCRRCARARVAIACVPGRRRRRSRPRASRRAAGARRTA